MRPYNNTVLISKLPTGTQKLCFNMYCQQIESHSNCSETDDDLVCCVQKIVRYVQPVAFDERAINILNRFLEDHDLYCLPVLKNDLVCGLINRHRFMEINMIGKSGYGYSLNYYKTAEPLLEDSFLQLDAKTTIEQAAKLIETRSRVQRYDDICITNKGTYIGIVSVSDILSAITKNNLVLAVGANPLSRLPGNDFIQRKIREFLTISESFDICYIDIDSFKPYNDTHGFARGDEVIKTVADIIVTTLARYATDTVNFTGHIGGDDFIVLTTPGNSMSICQAIISQFNYKLEQFHGIAEFEARYYESMSRKGEWERFPLLSLSIVIISTEDRKYSSYAEISSVASGLKKKAKLLNGSVVLKDQRLS